jgi:hypothetical protein
MMMAYGAGNMKMFLLPSHRTVVVKLSGNADDNRFLGLLLGTVFFVGIKDWLLEVGVIAGNQKPLTLHGLLGLPYAPTALVLGAAVLAIVMGIDRLTPERSYEPAAERKSVIDYLRGEWSFVAGGVVGGLVILLATMQGRLWIVDWKATDAPQYRWQLAAYADALADDGLVVKDGLTVELGADGKWKEGERVDIRAAIAEWRNILNVYGLKKREGMIK